MLAESKFLSPKSLRLCETRFMVFGKENSLFPAIYAHTVNVAGRVSGHVPRPYEKQGKKDTSQAHERLSASLHRWSLSLWTHYDLNRISAEAGC
jgi:hypothetical protein